MQNGHRGEHWSKCRDRYSDAYKNMGSEVSKDMGECYTGLSRSAFW